MKVLGLFTLGFVGVWLILSAHSSVVHKEPTFFQCLVSTRMDCK